MIEFIQQGGDINDYEEHKKRERADSIVLPAIGGGPLSVLRRGSRFIASSFGKVSTSAQISPQRTRVSIYPSPSGSSSVDCIDHNDIVIESRQASASLCDLKAAQSCFKMNLEMF